MANARSILSFFSRQIVSNNVNILSHTNAQTITHRLLSSAASSLSQSQNNKTETAAATDTVKDDADQPPTESNESPQTDLLNKQIKKLNNDLADLKDKYQRTLADRENVRIRLEKQVSDAKLYGIQGFCKELLEVSDVFRKALDSVPKSEVDSGSEQLRSLYDGLSMTETQLLAVFRRHGLGPISLESGGKFDPSWQEAMFEVPSGGEEQKLPGTVASVLRQGWKLHDRCIRSAQVGVYKE